MKISDLQCKITQQINRMNPDCAITAGRAHRLKEPDKKLKKKNGLCKKRKGVEKTANG